MLAKTLFNKTGLFNKSAALQPISNKKEHKSNKKAIKPAKKRETGYEKKKFNNIGQKLDSQKACFALRTSRGACQLSTQIKKYFCDTATLEIRGFYSSMNRNQQSNKTR